MATTRVHTALLALVLCLASVWGAPVLAAPYAALVMDARTGEVLHARNADTRLHPASLTKMMTLYIAFQAIEAGEISLDTEVRISKNAASEPPSKLGLRTGQRIQLRYLIRAAAVKSANDAATAIGEAISGSEENFTRRMDATAKSLGMTRSNFKNAHGLTANGHLSTARDMTVLGRHLLYDFPAYYNLFSRQTTDAGTTTVRNTNIRLLQSYRGADGIKTGYTRAAGFNLVSSAERGSERIIATVFGGRSSATRNARIAELLDMGFERAPSRAAVRKPVKPNAVGGQAPVETARGLAKSARPLMRPLRKTPDPEDVLVAELTPEPTITPAPGPLIIDMIATRNAPDADPEAELEPEQDPSPEVATAALSPTIAQVTGIVPQPRPSLGVSDTDQSAPVVVTRSASGVRGGFGIQLELQSSRVAADRLLLRTALQELDALDNALRLVRESRRGYQPSFEGLTQTEATRACTRLLSRQVACAVTGS